MRILNKTPEEISQAKFQFVSHPPKTKHTKAWYQINVLWLGDESNSVHPLTVPEMYEIIDVLVDDHSARIEDAQRQQREHREEIDRLKEIPQEYPCKVEILEAENRAFRMSIPRDPHIPSEAEIEAEIQKELWQDAKEVWLREFRHRLDNDVNISSAASQADAAHDIFVKRFAPRKKKNWKEFRERIMKGFDKVYNKFQGESDGKTEGHNPESSEQSGAVEGSGSSDVQDGDPGMGDV